MPDILRSLAGVAASLVAPPNWRKMNGVAFALAIAIWGLFGVLFTAGGWPAIRGGEWSSERAAVHGLFVVGLILLAQVAAAVVSFLRANGETT